ncbi:RING finger and CHY zinc finger domain-containing protein 1 [Anopheles bellator]|uniref:RING finger and CHY zinc finger domain-containing protein 1 n=1 Tax=Anopheles bellator TaxID=139047 RepID=UPI0026492901|nr:RING finger and CHY zinc finger domain-containing protein 1 [Anopheles bellator]XP_058057245.1 RING finger and CHY zinc finger domain-containing protein 1 [Anopheles bellator]
MDGGKKPIPTANNANNGAAAMTTATGGGQQNEKRVGCAHYKRRAKFVTPCCNKFYMCRYCHDENETHFFNRKTVTELICTECNTRQRVQAECEKCGVRFGRYTCLVCNLFDDEDRNQYHCDGCGICRVGGRGRFFHCEVCNMCLPLQLKYDGHRCVENVSRSNCPVCLDDIHTSRIPCHIPDCGHLLHRTCFEELLSSGHYACPTCQTSMMDMNQLWEFLDAEVAATPMPKEYENYYVDILCKDCHKESTVKFHVVGLKCTHCGAYNTCRTKTKPIDGTSNGSSGSGAPVPLPPPRMTTTAMATVSSSPHTLPTAASSIHNENGTTLRLNHLLNGESSTTSVIEGGGPSTSTAPSASSASSSSSSSSSTGSASSSSTMVSTGVSLTGQRNGLLAAHNGPQVNATPGRSNTNSSDSSSSSSSSTSGRRPPNDDGDGGDGVSGATAVDSNGPVTNGTTSTVASSNADGGESSGSPPICDDRSSSFNSNSHDGAAQI